MHLTIETWEREYIRELAKKQQEIAALPIMQERTKRWYAHNEMKKGSPMIVVEMATFAKDVTPALKTQSPLARNIEGEIQNNILVHELLDDDEVCPDYVTVSWDITKKEYGLDIPVTRSKDKQGRDIGFTWDHPIKNIPKDFEKLKPFTFSVNKENSFKRLEAAKDILDGVLDVHLEDGFHRWGNMTTLKAIELMGMETWMTTMLDSPKDLHWIMNYLTENLLAYTKWQEDEGLLTMNNKNHFTGAGSRGFTNELKQADDGKVRRKDMWVNVNSQESTGISPAMYKEFVYPYIEEIAKQFGMVYYGCCEAVDPLWDICLKDLSNLRKVSISPWCNEQFMGERLRGGDIIYSRKPSPHFLGVGYDFDNHEYLEYMKKTLNAAKGCNLEIIFRDVYTLSGNIPKAKRAVHLLRELIEKHWE